MKYFKVIILSLFLVQTSAWAQDCADQLNGEYELVEGSLLCLDKEMKVEIGDNNELNLFVIDSQGGFVEYDLPQGSGAKWKFNRSKCSFKAKWRDHSFITPHYEELKLKDEETLSLVYKNVWSLGNSDKDCTYKKSKTN